MRQSELGGAPRALASAVGYARTADDRGGVIEITETVRAFLLELIGTAERLDVLLFLYRQNTRWWAAEDMTGALGMSPHSVQKHLETLSAANLLDVRVADEIRYMYRPGRPELAERADEVARAHYANRDAVLAVLARRTPESIRLFASAFRLRPRDKR